ncbi:MAG: endonuclease/exonuclease/phosphatase family protein [Bacteriovoracaceae bacterium]
MSYKASLGLLLLSFSLLAQEIRVPIKKNRAEKSKFLEVKEGEEIQIFNSTASKEALVSKKEISLISWNVFKGVKKELFTSYPDLAKNYDFILLQEAYTIPEMLKMFEATPYHYVLAGSFVYRPLMVTTGVATGSRFQSIKNIPLRSKYKEPIVDAAQMCLSTEYKLAGREDTLLVVNVHAINFVISDRLFHQLDQLKDHIKQHKGPVIFAGDFNVWDEKKTKYLKRITKELNLKEISFKEDYRKRFRNHPLDYVFYRGLKVQTAKVLDLKSLSDHNPIEVNFSL